MGPNFLGKKLSVISKKKHQQPSIKKATIARAPANKVMRVC
jgi:hypothetical protein